MIQFMEMLQANQQCLSAHSWRGCNTIAWRGQVAYMPYLIAAFKVLVLLLHESLVLILHMFAVARRYHSGLLPLLVIISGLVMCQQFAAVVPPLLQLDTASMAQMSQAATQL